MISLASLIFLFSYIQKHLVLGNKIPKEGTDRSNEFVKEHLRKDGVFVMRLVGHNTNAITVNEFICELWESYLEKDDNRSQLMDEMLGMNKQRDNSP